MHADVRTLAALELLQLLGLKTSFNESSASDHASWMRDETHKDFAEGLHPFLAAAAKSLWVSSRIQDAWSDAGDLSNEVFKPISYDNCKAARVSASACTSSCSFRVNTSSCLEINPRYKSPPGANLVLSTLENPENFRKFLCTIFSCCRCMPNVEMTWPANNSR